MSKGGSPMGSGGFGGQQQQGGFGGSFGMPQQQQQRGFSGGFQPSRQGFGGGFGMPQQRQQQGFGNTLARTMPPPQQPQQQGFGSSLGNFLGGQGFNMPQQMRNPMRPMVSRMAPEQDQPSATPAPSTDMRAMMDPFRQQANQMMAAQNAALASRGMSTSDAVDYTDPIRGQSINIAQPPRPMTQPMAPQQAGSDAARLYEQFQSAQGMGKGRPGIDYPMVLPMPPQDNRPAQTQIPEGAQVSMARPQRLPNPYAQQVRQEDPRMQAMRMMQRMNFGGGGGYNF